MPKHKRVAVGFYKDDDGKTRPVTKPLGELKRKKVIQKPKKFKGVSPRYPPPDKTSFGKVWFKRRLTKREDEIYYLWRLLRTIQQKGYVPRTMKEPLEKTITRTNEICQASLALNQKRKDDCKKWSRKRKTFRLVPIFRAVCG